MKKIKVCPICGTEMKIDTSAVCTSIPPMYRCVCPSCNCLDFIKTSEYDQYKEEPSLPEGLEEAAKEYTDGKSWAKENYLTPYIREAFIAGAEWQKAKMNWHSVEECLPEMDEEVIVLADRLNLGSLFAITIGHIVDKEKAVDYNGWNIPGVKLWMPMPKIPNEK